MSIRKRFRAAPRMDPVRVAILVVVAMGPSRHASSLHVNHSCCHFWILVCGVENEMESGSGVEGGMASAVCGGWSVK